MTRNEQILSEVQKRFSSNDAHLVSKISTFIDGAKWADEHPQFSKEEFIEKACEWLWNEIYERVDDSEIKEALYEDNYRANLVAAFREYMEK